METKSKIELVRIARQRNFQYGKAGVAIQIPPIFVEDHNIVLKDEFEIFRSEINGEDVLIIVPPKNGKAKKQ